MTAPARIRLSRARGWRLPEGATSVARPHKLGNPFVVGKYGTRAECVSAYALLAAGFIDLGTSHVSVETQIKAYDAIQASIRKNAGETPACWCDHKGPCHGDVLAHLWAGGSIAGLTKFHVQPPRGRIGMMVADLRKRAAKARKKAAADKPPT